MSASSACRDHGVEALLTRTDHACGSDRLAEACELLGLAGRRGRQRAGRRAADRARADRRGGGPARSTARSQHEHRRARHRQRRGVPQSQRREGGARCAGHRALLQPRADPVVARRLCRRHQGPAEPRPLRHIGIYGYRAGFLREFPRLPPAPIEATEALEQLRALWHGHRIAVHVTATAPGPASTRRKTWRACAPCGARPPRKAGTGVRMLSSVQ